MLPATQKIGRLNVWFMMMLSIGLYTHVIMTITLLVKGGRDAWMGIGIAGLVMLVWVAILSLISKRLDGKAILTWIQDRFGIVTKYVLTIPLTLCMFMMTWVTFKDTISWSAASYLPFTPPVILATALAFVCCWSCSSGLQNVALTAGILGPFVILFGIFIMTANIPKKHYTNVFPILEHGMTPVWWSTLYVLGGLMELFILLLIQQYVERQMTFTFFAILLLCLVSITIGPYMGAIASFGISKAAIQRYPAFEQWRILEIGKYIDHVDFLSIYQWLSGAFVRISLLGFVIMDSFGIQKQKNRRFFLAGLFALLTVCVLLPISDMKFLGLLLTYYTPITVTVFCGSTLLIFLLVILDGKRVKYR